MLVWLGCGRLRDDVHGAQHEARVAGGDLLAVLEVGGAADLGVGGRAGAGRGARVRKPCRGLSAPLHQGWDHDVMLMWPQAHGLWAPSPEAPCRLRERNE